LKAKKYPTFRTVVDAAANHPSARITRSRQQEIHKEKHPILKLRLYVKRHLKLAER